MEDDKEIDKAEKRGAKDATTELRLANLEKQMGRLWAALAAAAVLIITSIYEAVKKALWP